MLYYLMVVLYIQLKNVQFCTYNYFDIKYFNVSKAQFLISNFLYRYLKLC